MKIDKLDYFWYKETDSTNLRAKEAGNKEKDIRCGMVFIADKQTAGVGRRGRSWESPEGENIYMSLLLKPEIEPAKAPMLTLVMALAVAKAVKEAAGVRMQIKWPNDLIMNKKKVCGILTEMSLEGSGIKYVVIGVGINVNQREFSEEIENKATSLALETSKNHDRDVIIKRVMQAFYEYYEQFLETKDLSLLQDAYNEMLVNCGNEVCIHEPGNEYLAKALGINEQGELVVETNDGVRQKIFAGEVSVRGIYGYV